MHHIVRGLVCSLSHKIRLVQVKEEVTVGVPIAWKTKTISRVTSLLTNTTHIIQDNIEMIISTIQPSTFIKHTLLEEGDSR